MESTTNAIKFKSCSVRRSEVEGVDRTFQIEGVIQLVLSNITQKSIGCVVGEDITADSNWIFIPKEKLADNLELHEKSSDFLPIKKKILAYAEDTILLGFIRPVEDDKQLFYICTTVTAKDTVVKILDRQKTELHDRLIASVYKVPQIWESFGSESEVEDSMIKNFRPLIEIEVESKYPLYTEKKKFRPRFVEDAVDGYIEILPGRFTFTNILRKRIDVAVQVTPTVTENEAQTNPAYPKNIYTQYNYEYKEPKLNRFHYEYINKFLASHIDNLDDTIHVNENINLYTNDYMKIAKPIVKNLLIVNRDLISFRDVITCKDKSVAEIELHPLISNIIATSYGRVSFNKMNTGPTGEDDINVTTFGKHLALIWCHAEPLKPRLFLYAYREITVLRFSPMKPNILVGGCRNGQIVLWDISGRLEKVETREILTPSELKHRMIMQSMMTWMKNTYNISVILPTVLSALDGSHNAAVCKIIWMLPQHKVTKNGKVEKCSIEDPSNQFITAAMDGKILVWDLQSIPKVAESQKKKSQRLEERPLALVSDVSELKHMNNLLTPIYKINLRNKTTTIPYPMSTMFCKSMYLGFSYVPKNPDAMDDCIERTYFETVKHKEIPEFHPVVSVGDNLGNVFQCSFEGHDFDQGQKLNYENCQYIQFSRIHDGPIRSLYPNRSNQNIVLTVGGRVFAIWDMTMPPDPVLYRKSKYRYVAGVWCSQHIGAVVIARADSYLETWELLHRTKTPGRIVRMSGNTIIDLFSDMTRFHRSKNTFITTDVVGAVRLYKIPEYRAEPTKDEYIYGNFLCARVFQRRKNIKIWFEEYKRKYLTKQVLNADEGTQIEAPVNPPAETKTEEKEEKPEEDKSQRKSVIEKLKTQSGNTWAEKQEKIMYRILLEKKKLNLAEIEKNKAPLKKLYEEQQHKGKKTVEMLEKKEDIFLTAKKRLFKATEVKKKKKITVSFPEEIEETMKETFIEQYKAILDDTLLYVESNEFRYIFDWGAMIAQGKERRRCANAVFQRQARQRRVKSRHSDNLDDEDEEEEDEEAK